MQTGVENYTKKAELMLIIPLFLGKSTPNTNKTNNLPLFARFVRVFCVFCVVRVHTGCTAPIPHHTRGKYMLAGSVSIGET